MVEHSRRRERGREGQSGASGCSPLLPGHLSRETPSPSLQDRTQGEAAPGTDVARGPYKHEPCGHVWSGRPHSGRERRGETSQPNPTWPGHKAAWQAGSVQGPEPTLAGQTQRHAPRWLPRATLSSFQQARRGSTTGFCQHLSRPCPNAGTDLKRTQEGPGGHVHVHVSCTPPCPNHATLSFIGCLRGAN